MTIFNEDVQIVRCNQCMHIFPEEFIVSATQEDSTQEWCPDCGESGCLMDMGEYGKEDDKVLFPYLTQSERWEWLKQHFYIHALCEMENEIRDIKEGVIKVEDYPTIYQWWEGLMDNEELFNVYDKHDRK